MLRLARFVNGYPFKPGELGQDGLPVVRIRHLLDDSVEPERASTPDRPVFIDDDDLVFSWSATLAVRRWHRGRALLNQHLFRVDPTVGVNARWLQYVLEVGIERLRPLMHGSAMTHITKDMLRRVCVRRPELAEQIALADYLDTETARIDALSTKKQHMADLLSDREEALVSDRFQTLEDEYGSVPVRRLLSRLEQGSSPVCDSQPAQPDEWGVLKTSAVSTGVFLAYENKRLPNPHASDLRWRVSDGDLLMTRGSGSINSVGRAAVARLDGQQLLLSDLLYRLSLCDSDPDFVALALRRPKSRQQVHASIRSDVGQTLKLRADDILQIKIPAVPAGRQREYFNAIADELTPLYEVRLRLLKQVDLLSEHRHALITAAVIGEVEVPGMAS